MKYVGSYSLSDFADISVDGQRIVCTFAIARDVKLILHARTNEAAVWWARRMKLHQAFFACTLPGISDAATAQLLAHANDEVETKTADPQPSDEHSFSV